MIGSLSRRTIAFTLSAACAGSAGAAAQGQAPPRERFAQVAAARAGLTVPEVALDRVEGPILLQDLGLELYVASAAFGVSEKEVVALDSSGREVDLRQALALDRALGSSRRGKLARPLFEKLAAAAADERVLAVAWLALDPPEDLRAAHAEEVEALDRLGALTHEAARVLQAELDAGIAARIDPVTLAAAERFAAAGLRVVGRDSYAPLVFVQATPAELSLLATDPEVSSLDYAGTDYGERLNVAVGEVRASSVWTAPGGVTGAGAKVSIVEGGAVCTTNPYLAVAATRTAGGVSSHTTGVGSCVASTHATYKGVAPGATLISANAADFVTNSTNVTTQMPGSVAAVSWSVTNGAQIMNLSYGAASPGPTVSSFDKYLDWVIRNNGRTICISSGNSGNYAGDPGAGFNQISVGAFNDNNSSAWSGETMASFSSWRNPSTGLETPQVAGPGVNVTMLTCSSPWTGYTASGTSFSSPITAGACALVVSKQPALGGWPEPVRAIVMASAWHNIEGAAALSSKDGAGGVDALAAFRVAARGAGVGYNYGTLTTASFDASGFYTALSASATAGQTVRVCLSFDSTPSGGPTYSPDNLLCDLDLYVYGPTGAQVASSLSGTQPFEVVHFSAGSSGTYTVKIKNYSFSGSSEYFGVAFSTSADQ